MMSANRLKINREEIRSCVFCRIDFVFRIFFCNFSCIFLKLFFPLIYHIFDSRNYHGASYLYIGFKVAYGTLLTPVI